MKPATIATKLVAKYGTAYARGLAHGRMRLSLYGMRHANGTLRRHLDSSTVHRAIVWMTVGQLIDKVGVAEGWGGATKACTCTSGIHDGLCMKGCRASWGLV